MSMTNVGCLSLPAVVHSVNAMRTQVVGLSQTYLSMSNCPFSNLPDRRRDRWGQGITAAMRVTTPAIGQVAYGCIDSNPHGPRQRIGTVCHLHIPPGSNPPDCLDENHR